MPDTFLAVGFDGFQHTRPFDVTITRSYTLQDFYRSERGSDVYVDVRTVISAWLFYWVEIQMRGWTLRVEPEIADDERQGKRCFVLTRTETGGEPQTETMEFEDLFSRGGVPLTGLHMLALMNHHDFVRLEHRVGRTQICIVPKVASSGEAKQAGVRPGDVA